MLLTDHEVQTCLVYALKPILKKYSVQMKDVHLTIHDMIYVDAVIVYQDKTLDLSASFTIDYKEHLLCFENINGQIEYLFLQLDVLSVLQQFIHDDQFIFKNHSCFYKCDLPIEELSIEDEHLYICLKE